MDFPARDTMCLLLAVAANHPPEVSDGELICRLPLPGGKEHIVLDVLAEYEALEQRGWITTDDPPKATEQGHYALERWFKQEYGIKLKAQTIRMGVYR